MKGCGILLLVLALIGWPISAAAPVGPVGEIILTQGTNTLFLAGVILIAAAAVCDGLKGTLREISAGLANPVSHPLPASESGELVASISGPSSDGDIHPRVVTHANYVAAPPLADRSRKHMKMVMVSALAVFVSVGSVAVYAAWPARNVSAHPNPQDQAEPAVQAAPTGEWYADKNGFWHWKDNKSPPEAH